MKDKRRALRRYNTQVIRRRRIRSYLSLYYLEIHRDYYQTVQAKKNMAICSETPSRSLNVRCNDKLWNAVKFAFQLSSKQWKKDYLDEIM